MPSSEWHIVDTQETSVGMNTRGNAQAVAHHGGDGLEGERVSRSTPQEPRVRLTPERERENTRNSNEVPKRTGVTLETSVSEMWFFICMVRSLDRMVSGDYGQGS